MIRVTDVFSEQRVTDPNFWGKDASSCFSCGKDSFYIVKTNPFLKQKHVSYAFKTFGLVALTSQKDFKIRARETKIFAFCFVKIFDFCFPCTDFNSPCMHRIHNKAGREGMPQSVLEGMRFSLNLFWLKKALKVAKKSGDPVPAGIKSPKITRSFKPRKKSVLPSIAARLKIRVVS